MFYSPVGLPCQSCPGLLSPYCSPFQYDLSIAKSSAQDRQVTAFLTKRSGGARYLFEMFVPNFTRLLPLGSIRERKHTRAGQPQVSEAI